MDQFILDCVEELGINLQDYNLPQDLSEFTKVTKNVKVKDDYRFKTLFQAIENSKEVSLFRSVLNYLNKYQYQSKTEELQSLFKTKVNDGLVLHPLRSDSLSVLLVFLLYFSLLVYFAIHFLI